MAKSEWAAVRFAFGGFARRFAFVAVDARRIGVAAAFAVCADWTATAIVISFERFEATQCKTVASARTAKAH